MLFCDFASPNTGQDEVYLSQVVAKPVTTFGECLTRHASAIRSREVVVTQHRQIAMPQLECSQATRRTCLPKEVLCGLIGNERLIKVGFLLRELNSFNCPREVAALQPPGL